MSRIHYTECLIAVEATADRGSFECDDAEVWIEEESIRISYFDDDGIVVLEGSPEKATDTSEATFGAWTLSARSRPWRAFLRPMDEAPGTYTGEIDEHGEIAVWRLRLGEPELK